jgi:hypothetical protein
MIEYFGALAVNKSKIGEIEHDFFGYFSDATTIGTILSFVISIATAYLAYQCNKTNGIIIRILVTILAFLFSGVYLIYYLFAHVLFGKGCDTSPVNFKKMRNKGSKLKKNLVKKGRKLEKKL